MPRRAEHLQRRESGHYYFRMRVPAELRKLVGKDEYHTSLRTSDPAEAKRRLVIHRFKASSEIDAARCQLAAQLPTGAPSKPDLNEDDLWNLALSWFVDQQRDDALRGPADVNPQSAREELAYLTDPQDTNVLASIRSFTRKFLADRRIALSSDHKSFLRLEKLIHEAMIEREKRLIRRFFSFEVGDLNPRFKGFDASTTLHPGANDITLSELIERYEGDLVRHAHAPKTTAKRIAQMRFFREVVGPDTRIRKIGREEARRLLDVVSRLPANATKKYRGMSVSEVLQLPADQIGQPLSSTTANSYLDSFSRLMDFALNEDLVQRNPCKGLSVPKRERGRPRVPFATADLQRIFTAPLYTGCKNDERGYAIEGPNRPRRGRFWVPLIALYSGLRETEICQLAVDDIAIVSGCDVILVRADEDGTKRLKTAAAERIMPIHPILKQLGLLQYAHTIRRNGKVRLFPELTIASTGYAGDNFSKWFAHFLDHIGIVDEKKTFHSMRHNFRDALRNADVSLERVRLLGGWSSEGSDARYGGSIEIAAVMLTKEIAKVGFPGLHLEHLMQAGQAADD